MHINSLHFILQFIYLLSYNSLNIFIPLLMLDHLLLIVGLQKRVDCVGVGFSTGLGGFVVAAPAQQHKRYSGLSDP